MKFQGKVLILGADGYLGWSLLSHFRSEGYEVKGLDNYSRRGFVSDVGSDSLFPLTHPMDEDRWVGYIELRMGSAIDKVLKDFKPDVIIHLAEQPSAPYSMRDSKTACATQSNNVQGTLNLIWAMREHCPEAHLIKLGTMGEYSDWIYEGMNIPESSTIFAMLGGTTDHQREIPTPRFAGSFYHMSKIFDSYNIEFACRMWGLRATDINQGVVYGTKIDGMDNKNRTRFDYDSYFGTAVNRFCVQAVAGVPLTIYGEGGQTRGYININDVVRAIKLVMDNGPEAGNFQIVNQLTEVMSVLEIADLIREETGCEVKSITNPRIEKEKHVYKPTHEKLKRWGLTEPRFMVREIKEMLADVTEFKDNIKMDVIQPQAQWRSIEEGERILA